MKKFVAAAALLLVMAAGCKQEEAAVAPLQVKGTVLYAGEKPFCAKGVSFGWHNLWPRFYNPGCIGRLASDWGVDIFRAAIGADSHANADNPGCHDGYTGEKEFALEKLYALVDGAVEAGVYIIVDWHSHVTRPEEAREFFDEVSRRYADCPNVIYELFNEPVCESFEAPERSYADLGSSEAMEAFWLKLKAYSEDLIGVITANSHVHPLILVGCPSWDQRIDLPAAAPVQGYDNVMYTVHFYAGTHKADLRERCSEALRAGTPIFISECACCDASGDGEMDLESWREWDSWATENGVTMLTWSISDKNETCSMFTPEASSEGPWSDDVIKPWGKIVKEWTSK